MASRYYRQFLFPHFVRFVCRLSCLCVCIVIFFSLNACSFAGFGGPQDEELISVYHRVAKGDTLQSISKRYGVPRDRIANMNGIHNPLSLKVGQRLLIAYAAHRSLPEPSKKGGSASDKNFVAGSMRLSDKDNVQFTSGRLHWPVGGSGRLVSYFGPRGDSFHDGIDVSAASGTPVLASHSGRVAYADSELSGYGKLMIIKGNEGLTTVYAHNRRMFKEKGQRVKKGEPIAEVGSTGRSSGPHLHFEVRKKDKKGRQIALDPIPFFKKTSKTSRYRVNENLTPILDSSDDS